jgi:predicted membrane chloride channel (bestrophin family)
MLITGHPFVANLTAALNMLVEGLTGLERILTTPIPFSFVDS